MLHSNSAYYYLRLPFIEKSATHTKKELTYTLINTNRVVMMIWMIDYVILSYAQKSRKCENKKQPSRNTFINFGTSTKYLF